MQSRNRDTDVENKLYPLYGYNGRGKGGEMKRRLGLTHLCLCSLVLMLNSVQLLAIPWTVLHQAPLSLGFSRQEYWSGLPFPTSGALPHPGIEPMSLVSPTLAGGFFTTVPPGEAYTHTHTHTHTHSTMYEIDN